MQSLIPPDGGPMYAETDLSAFVSEPWNAISSLAIALPSLYWAIRLRWNFKEYGFLFFLMPLLFLGGTGSLLYHAFRASKLLLWMDVYPTVVVTLSVSIYFWDKVLAKRWQVASIILPFTLTRYFMYDIVSARLAVNLNYLFTGILIFLPILIFLARNERKHATPVFISVVFLSLSLLMRRIDYAMAEVIPMGSHFLWHIFSGIGAFYLAKFLYLIRRDELATHTL